MKIRLGIGFLVLLATVFAIVRFGGSSESAEVATSTRSTIRLTGERTANPKLTTGRVVDRSGAPIGSALVVFAGSRPVHAITGRDGGWATAIADGTYTVSVSAVGFLPNTRTITLDESRETVLERGGIELRGAVEDVSGGPIAGARIRFVDSETEALVGVVLVDEGGRYAASLPAVRLVATAEADGYATANRMFDLRGRITPPADFELVIGGTIRGSVVGPDKGPCREAVVFAEVGTDYHKQKMHVTANPAGEFVLDGLQPGDVSMHASGPGCTTRDPKVVELTVGGVVEGVTIAAERAFTLTGTVVERGTRDPIANVEIRLDKDQMWTIRGGIVTSDDAGRYVIHGILPGTYELDVTSTRHLVELLEIEVAADSQRDIELSRGRTISGRFDPPTVAKLELELHEYNAVDLTSRRKQEIGATTKSDGTFVIENAVDGALVLGARSDDGTSFGTVVLAEQGDQRDLTIAMKPFGDTTVSGVVVEESGKPVAGVEIGVWWPNDRFGEIRKLFTAADGSFRFEHLPRRELGFAIEGRTPLEPDQLLHTPSDHSKLRIVVRDQAGSIRGRVLDPDGKPAADVAVTAMPRIEGLGSIQVPRAVTDVTGAFVLGDLPGGDYEIGVTTPSGDGRSVVNARTGEQLTIKLARSGRILLHVTQNNHPVPAFRLACKLETPARRLDMGTMSSFSSSSNGRSDGTYRSDESYPLGRAACHVSADAGGVTATIEIGKVAELSLTAWAKVRGMVVDRANKPRSGRLIYIHGDTKPSANPDDDLGRHAYRDYAELDSGRLIFDQAFPGVGWIAIYAADFSRLLGARRIDAVAGAQIELGTITVD